MLAFKTQFYHNGVENQKRADITIDLKRCELSKIKKWPLSEQLTLIAFLNEAKGKIDEFLQELTDAAK